MFSARFSGFFSSAHRLFLITVVLFPVRLGGVAGANPGPTEFAELLEVMRLNRGPIESPVSAPLPGHPLIGVDQKRPRKEHQQP